MQPPEDEVPPSEGDTQPAAAAVGAVPNLARHGEALAWLAELTQPRYGGFWRRAGAFFLDGLIFSMVGVPSSILTLVAYGSAASTIASILLGLIAIAVVPYCWARWGMTPGKALMGLRIVRLEDLGPISGWRAVGRYFAQIMAWLPLGLGILWVAWDKRKRGWHDRLADTLVLRVPSLRESGSPRRKWAIAAALAGIPAYGLSIFVVISITLTTLNAGFRDASGAIAFPQDMGILALRTGDCFDDTALDVNNVRATPCVLEHTYEVFGTPQLPNGAYPSDTDMDNLAAEHCVPLFRPFVGAPIETSGYFGSYFGPDQQQWTAGTRTLICYLYNEDQSSVRGSARGSGD